MLLHEKLQVALQHTASCQVHRHKSKLSALEQHLKVEGTKKKILSSNYDCLCAQKQPELVGVKWRCAKRGGRNGMCYVQKELVASEQY